MEVKFYRVKKHKYEKKYPSAVDFTYVKFYQKLQT